MRCRRNKKVYTTVITAMLVCGLLCPQTLLAEGLPPDIEEAANVKLASFEKVDLCREREKELLQNREEIIALGARDGFEEGISEEDIEALERRDSEIRQELEEQKLLAREQRLQYLAQIRQEIIAATGSYEEEVSRHVVLLSENLRIIEAENYWIATQEKLLYNDLNARIVILHKSDVTRYLMLESSEDGDISELRITDGTSDVVMLRAKSGAGGADGGNESWLFGDTAPDDEFCEQYCNDGAHNSGEEDNNSEYNPDRNLTDMTYQDKISKRKALDRSIETLRAALSAVSPDSKREACFNPAESIAEPLIELLDALQNPPPYRVWQRWAMPRPVNNKASDNAAKAATSLDPLEPYRGKKTADSDKTAAEAIGEVKNALSAFADARRSAVKMFYDDVSPYYSELESVLKKAHLLWWEQGIDTRIYYRTATGLASSEDIREAVEKAVAGLRGEPAEKRAIAGDEEKKLREDITALEKELRKKIVDPALEAYKETLKEASEEFYKSVGEKTETLAEPVIKDVNGELEVIIVLPAEKQSPNF